MFLFHIAMKQFVLIVVACLGLAHAVVKYEHYPEKLKQATQRWHDICLANSGTHEDTIEALRHGNFPEEDELKKYTMCIFKYSGVLTRDGKIHPGIVADFEPPQWKDRGVETLTKCYEQHQGEADTKEKIYKSLKCVYKADPENFGFP